MKIPKGLKRGDLIEVIGIDWTTDSNWIAQSRAIDYVGQPPTIHQAGYFLGTKNGNFYWAATVVLWDEEPKVKYTHMMSLKAISKIRKLR